MAQLHHGGPGGGDEAARARALHARRGVLPPAPVGQVEVLRVAQRLGAEGEDRGALEGVPVLVGVGRDGRHARDGVVERGDVVAELAAEGEDEAAEAGVDVQPDAALEGDVGEVGDGVDGAVAVVAGGPDEGNRLVVHVVAHPVHVDLGRDRVDRRPPQLDAEEVAGLVEGGVRRLGLDHVGPRHAARLGRVLAVGQDRVQDAARPAGGDQAARVVARRHRRVAGLQAERHGDDLGLELRGARAHVALQDVDVGEEPEGLVHEAVVVVVPAVHGARALARLPEGVLLVGHGAELGEDLLAARPCSGSERLTGKRSA